VTAEAVGQRLRVDCRILEDAQLSLFASVFAVGNGEKAKLRLLTAKKAYFE
jgi:hypothetical protein